MTSLVNEMGRIFRATHTSIFQSAQNNRWDTLFRENRHTLRRNSVKSNIGDWPLYFEMSWLQQLKCPYTKF